MKFLFKSLLVFSCFLLMSVNKPNTSTSPDPAAVFWGNGETICGEWVGGCTQVCSTTFYMFWVPVSTTQTTISIC